MKQKTFFLILTFFTLIVSGCQQKSSSKKSSTANPSTVNCSGEAYWTGVGCTGYCQHNPTAAACTTSGTTTGATAGGTTGGTTGANCSIYPLAASCPGYCQQVPRPNWCLSNGTNCSLTPTAAGCPGASVVVNPYWGIFYPPSGTPPAGTCSEPVAPAGLATPAETRKATITMAGAISGSIEYNPLTASNLLNTSPMLKSVSQAKLFFMTDAVLKLRVKVKPQPESRQTTNICYGRDSGTYIAGYTKLEYYVNVYGVTSGSALGPLLGTEGPFRTSVNSCSEVIDLSGYQEENPTGVVVSINNVKANQNCSPWAWDSVGWSNCNSFKNVRSMDCWSIDLEVAADGTKTF